MSVAFLNERMCVIIAAIKNTCIENADVFTLEHRLWGTEAYKNLVYAQLAYDNHGFAVKFTVEEKNPLREKKQHLEYVHEDSCVEFFVNFLPEHSEKYINFEVNAAGVMNAGFQSGRHDSVPLKEEEISGLHIKAEVLENQWTVMYHISFDFIKKYYPEFEMKNCSYIKGNLYKCGDKTEMEHYVSYFKVGTEKPDYHRPEFFGKIYVDASCFTNKKIV